MSLLDDYLNGSDGSLSGDEDLLSGDFDSQLLGSDRSDTNKLAVPTEGLDVKALLADAFKKAGKQMEREEEVRSGVKMASHSVRVLGSLYSSIIKNVDYDDVDRVNDLMRNTLSIVRDDAYKVTRACGLEDSEVPAWLHSQISGQVMEVISLAIERNNGSFESTRKSQYLQPLIDSVASGGAEGIGATFYARPDDPNLQLTNALMMATATVMTEYQAFSYFNSDPKAVASEVTQVLKSRVVDETLGDLSAKWNMTAHERAYIGTSLLSHAGKLMASSWSNNVLSTIEHVKSMDADERRATLMAGLPLTVVFEDFENFYGGLEVSAQASLELLRGESLGKSKDLASSKRESPSPRMG